MRGIPANSDVLRNAKWFEIGFFASAAKAGGFFLTVSGGSGQLADFVECALEWILVVDVKGL
jgi:hypothetical protein